MLWNPEEKPVANAAQFLGWARQEPLRTLYQSLRQNLLTWEAQAVMLGRAVKRRSEFETFHKILSGSFVSSLVKLRPSTRLACFRMYPDLLSYSCFWAFARAVPSPGSALPVTGCPSSESHVSFQRSLPWPQYWGAALYSWTSSSFSFIFLLYSVIFLVYILPLEMTFFFAYLLIICDCKCSNVSSWK